MDMDVLAFALSSRVRPMRIGTNNTSTIHPVLFVTMATIRSSGWFFIFQPYQTQFNLAVKYY